MIEAEKRGGHNPSLPLFGQQKFVISRIAIVGEKGWVIT
jgi:hypothetical protein